MRAFALALLAWDLAENKGETRSGPGGFFSGLMFVLYYPYSLRGGAATSKLT